MSDDKKACDVCGDSPAARDNDGTMLCMGCHVERYPIGGHGRSAAPAPAMSDALREAVREWQAAWTNVKSDIVIDEGDQYWARFMDTCERLAATPEPGSPPDEERIYPCDDCGKMRTKAEGGTVFTVCDTCWDKHHGRAAPAEPGSPGDVLVLVRALERIATAPCYCPEGADGPCYAAIAADALRAHHTSQAAVPVGPLRDDGVLREILKRCTADYERTRRSNLNETLDAIEAQLLARLRHTGER